MALSSNQGALAEYLSYNHRGDVVMVTTNDGVVCARQEYTAFGRPLTRNLERGTWNLRLGFSSKEYDSGSGLSYYGFRYYDPETGRWMKKDPIGWEDGVNPCLFVFNSPLDLVDGRGLTVRGIQGGFVAGCGKGIVYSLMGLVDDECQFALARAWSIVGYIGAAVGVHAGYYYSNADTVDDVAGLSGILGGSATVLPPLVSTGAEGSIFMTPKGTKYSATIGGGIGVGLPGEVHSGIEFTKIIAKRTFKDQNGCCDYLKGILWLKWQEIKATLTLRIF